MADDAAATSERLPTTVEKLALHQDNLALRANNRALLRRVSDGEASLAMCQAAVKALDHNEALFRAVIEKSAEVISLTSRDGSVRYLTPAAWQMLGWTAEEVGDRTFREQVVPEDRVRIEEALARLVHTGERDLSMDLQVRHRDGSIRWIESTATNLLDDPHVAAIVGNYRDITERRQAEDALRASHDMFEEAQSIAHIGSWSSTLGPEGQVSWSRESYRIFGIPHGTPMTVASFLACVHPDDRAAVMRTTRAAIEEGTAPEVEHRIVRPDGRVCRVHQRGVVERDATGQPIRMFGTLEDITERSARVEALRASEERYRRIVENTTEGVWMYDAEGITTFVNGQMARMLDRSVDEIVGKPMLAYAREASVPRALRSTVQRQRGVSERGELDLCRKDGTLLRVSIQQNPLFDAEGRYEAAFCLVTDVSPQHRADEVTAHLAALVESSEDAIISANLDGVITSWNRGAELLYQHQAADMIGRTFLDLIPPALVEDERAVLARVSLGEAVQQYDCERTRKDGSTVAVAVTVSPVRAKDGSVIGVSKIARDLTARRAAEAAHRRTEEQLRHAQKMEAVGQLAGGVAHDFNNLLTVILSYSDFALDDLKTGDPLCADITEIKQAALRASHLTAQLLAFSRQQVLQPAVVNLDEIVAGMTDMLQRLLGEDVELTHLHGERLGRVLADPGQIEQVVMNLAVNARDAMPDGGRLSIETRDILLDEDYVGGIAGVPAGEYVMLAVTDSGVGMDAATCTRIFEPFFTTKAAGKGTGLGLSTVFGIVQQSGGYLGVYSEVGHGSTFKAYFPRTDQIARAPVAAEPELMLRGSETILLVEDEKQVRDVACAILRRNGYTVLDAHNGGEAFLIAQDPATKIDLLFTDVVMPRMSGRKLAENLVGLRPELKVLFTSGYTDDAIVHHGVLEAGISFLQKPFTPDGLLRKLREVLRTRA